MTFSALENLTGGGQADRFILSRRQGISGRIDGGAGRNSLDYSAYTTPVRVNLVSGAATNIAGGVVHVSDVWGGSANDTLTGDSQDNLLDGGHGNDSIDGADGHDLLLGGQDADSLLGGGGRDLIFGGSGSDSLSGGDGEDILFNGPTSFDKDRKVLDALSSFWRRTDLGFLSRVTQLRAGVPDVPKLNSKHVSNDTSRDKLTGDGALDWFFANLSSSARDVITDLIPNEQTN